MKPNITSAQVDTNKDQGRTTETQRGYDRLLQRSIEYPLIKELLVHRDAYQKEPLIE